MFNIINKLEHLGHKIIPFSISYIYNQTTPYSKYFVAPLGSPSEVRFREQYLNLDTLWRTVKRSFYDPEVERAIIRLIKDTQPDVAYVLHYLRKLSPSLLVGLKRAGLPIVVRISDYAMLCPQAHCLRNGIPCELCIQGSLLSSLRYRCVQRSLAASFINALATLYHRFRHYFELINRFVVTNQFMYKMMISAGFSKNKLRCIPTFVDTELFRPSPGFVKDNYIIYAGRLEETKGVHILLDALALFHRKRPDLCAFLKIAGTGDKLYMTMLREKMISMGLQSCVEFIGAVSAEELSLLLSCALLSVVPSLWYENLPNVILESYACGTPVLASNLGSLTNCIKEGETGYLFQPGNANDLSEKLAQCFDHPQKLIEMAHKSRKVAEVAYSSPRHLSMLEELFDEVYKKTIN